MFEAKVLTLVTPQLDSGRAEFFNGTLFLEDVSNEDGKKVFNVLTQKFGEQFRFNTYNPVNGFVVDFV